MHVGILVTGDPPPALAERFGRYDAMIAALLGPDFTTTAYRVAEGQWPAAPDAHPAYVITGSSAGVYDDLPWIPPLKRFLTDARGVAKLVGICFGHQIMAEAFGGRVEKSDKGWGVGLHRYEMLAERPWMDGAAPIAIPVSHQDQVVAVPPDAEVLASCTFTPYAMLGWGEEALSMQCHPEFAPGFAAALYDSRRERIPDADGAIASLAAPNDEARVAGWIRRFLTGPGAR